MKVSVIIPFWNLENYVDRCLESVVGQSFNDIEIIAIDNGSSDGTREKLLSWQKKDKRIKVLTVDNNMGPGGVRNMGLDTAQGEYICFVDGDDCVHPLYVQNMLKNAEDNECYVAMCGYRTNDTTTKPIDIPMTLQIYPVEIINKKDYFLRMFTSSETPYIAVWGKIFHKSVFENTRFENMLNEDEEIIGRIIEQQEKIAVCDEPMYFYTQRHGSITKSSFTVDYMDIFPVYQQRIEYFEALGWQELAFMVMKKYIVHCFDLYTKIDSSVENYKDHKTHLKRMASFMLSQAKKSPERSKEFIKSAVYYSIFTNKYTSDKKSELMEK